MSNISTPTPPPNQNVVSFPAGTTTAPARAPAHFDVPRPNGLPDGYVYDETGLHEFREDKDGNVLPTRICSPLLVKGRCRTAAGYGWGRVLAVQDPDGTWHEVVIDNRQLAKSATAALAPLFELGFELAPVAKAAESVKTLLDLWLPEAQYLRFDRIGWTGPRHDTFVLGGGQFRAEKHIDLLRRL